jgi:hypothetical protein
MSRLTFTDFTIATGSSKNVVDADYKQKTFDILSDSSYARVLVLCFKPSNLAHSGLHVHLNVCVELCRAVEESSKRQSVSTTSFQPTAGHSCRGGFFAFRAETGKG